ncbi:MAG TPA: hypothetical protein VFS40_06835 [Gemmatimonadales bacterium]|nr:hypothetical protein [Gemmatimonadales bacterium]
MTSPTPPDTTPAIGHNLAGEPIDATRDLVGLAFGAMRRALLLGTGASALVLWAVRRTLAHAPAGDRPVVTGPAFYILTFGMLAAMALAGTAAWMRMATLGAPWRRGVLSAVCAFGVTVTSLAVTVVYHYLDQWFGWGDTTLLGLAVLLLGLVVVRDLRRR